MSIAEINTLVAASNRLTETVQGKIAEINTRVDTATRAAPLQPGAVLEVGAGKPFATPWEAWDSLTDKVITGPITIRIHPGTYETTGWSLNNQPYAHHIRFETVSRVMGDTIIHFVPDSAGVSHGIVINNCRNLHFDGTYKLIGQGDTTHRAVSVEQNSCVMFERGALAIEKVATGLLVASSSAVHAHNITIRDCINGIHAHSGGEAHSEDSILEGKGRSHEIGVIQDVGIHVTDGGRGWFHRTKAKHFRFGFAAERNGYLWCDHAIAEDCYHGYLAHYNATLWNYGHPDHPGVATDCDYGVVTHRGGTILFAYGEVTHTAYDAFYAETGSVIYAYQSHVSDARDAYHCWHNATIYAKETKAKMHNVRRATLTYGNGGVILQS